MESNIWDRKSFLYQSTLKENPNDFSDDPDAFSIESNKTITFNRTISHVQISNNLLVASSKNCILRKQLSSPGKPDEIPITQDPNDLVYSIFMDSLGRHIIISIQSAKDNNFYLHSSADRVKPLPKLSGQIESVAWVNSSLVRDNDTGPILIGTESGAIIEAQISSTDGLKYFKQLFVLQNSPITGILLQEIPRESSHLRANSLTPASFYVLFTTPGRLYQRIGEQATSTPIFANLFPSSDESRTSTVSGVKFMEFPRNFGYSFLRFYPTSDDNLPNTLAWGTGPGIYHCHLDINRTTAESDTVLNNNSLIPYPLAEKERAGSLMGVQLTQFYILVAYVDRIKAINVINKKVTFSKIIQLRGSERLMGLVRDPKTGKVYLHTDYSIYPFALNNESKDAWKMYLDAQQYDLARAYCPNEDAIDIVVNKQAEQLFKLQQYGQAAELYAETSISFEEIALKFVNLEDKSSLKTYLNRKVVKINAALETQTLASVKDKSGTFQRLPVLVMWLMEIYLSEIARLTSDREMFRENIMLQEEHRTLREEFRDYMSMPCVLDCLRLQPELVYSLMESHGNTDDMVQFATLMEDHKRVIEHYLYEKNYPQALAALVAQKNSKYYYDYANQLIRNLPQKTINAWIQKGPSLKPKELVPALLEADPMESYRYLEYAVGPLQCQNKEIHNLLIFVYATNAATVMKSADSSYSTATKKGPSPSSKSPNTSSSSSSTTNKNLWEEKLLHYLRQNDSSSTLLGGYALNSSCNFDPQYALRVCAEYGLLHASVRLHMMFGMHREAINDALSKDDVKLAKEIAQSSDIDSESQKQLWLKIAEHIVKKNGVDIREATQLIRECELIKLEDVLPLFPNFETIDNFRDAICESLEHYNQEIDKMKLDMKEAMESAAEIRRDIQQFNHRYVVVEAQHQCTHCKFPILLRTFYLFPCGHYFHTDCLAKLVEPYMSDEDRRKFSGLVKDYANSALAPGSRKEFDELIAADCYLCGNIAIDSIDKPFIDVEDYEEQWMVWNS